MTRGGLDYASRLLMETFGKDRADDLLALVRQSRKRPMATWASYSARIHSSWASCWTPSIRRPLLWFWLTWIRDGLDGAGQPERGA